MREKKFSEIMALKEHYKAIGETSFYLDNDDPSLPWERAFSIEPGGLWRFNTPVSFRVETCLIDGFTFKWSVDIEPRDANGKGYLDVDTQRMMLVYNKLPKELRPQFVAFFDQVGEELARQIASSSEHLARLTRDAAVIKGLAFLD